VLACAEPRSGNSVVAADLGLSTEAVRKWRARFAEHGLGGLADGTRPGRPKAGLVLTDAEREQLSRWARRAKILATRVGCARTSRISAASGTDSTDTDRMC
jgi:transposase